MLFLVWWHYQLFLDMIRRYASKKVEIHSPPERHPPVSCSVPPKLCHSLFPSLLSQPSLGTFASFGGKKTLISNGPIRMIARKFVKMKFDSLGNAKLKCQMSSVSAVRDPLAFTSFTEPAFWLDAFHCGSRYSMLTVLQNAAKSSGRTDGRSHLFPI